MVDGGSYITIGDTYKGNKIILPDRWKGKGLSVSKLGYFSHSHRPTKCLQRLVTFL